MNKKLIINIIGRIIFVEGLCMLLPIIVGIVCKENTIWAYAVTMAVMLIIGILSFFIKPQDMSFYAREGLVITGFGWFAVSIFGAVPIFLTREIPSYIDALFEIVSGFTTTGASILTNVEALSYSSLFWRSFTHWIGGMGVLVLIMAVLPQSETHSMYIMRAEVPGPAVDKMLSKVKVTARILYLIYVSLTALEVILLVCGKMPLFDALVNSFATAGTGGFAIKNASIAYYNNAYFDGVISTFMIVFSINFNLYFLLFIGSIKQIFKSEELRWFLFIVIAAIAAIAFDIRNIYGGFFESLRYSYFSVSSVISTTGFANADFNLWPNFSRTLLVVLMFFGACAGSTGGGIKIARIIIIVKSCFQYIRKQISPRSVTTVKYDGKNVSDNIFYGVHSFLFLYIVLFVSSMLIISLDEFDLITNFTAVTACINNIGPGLEIVGPAGNYSQFSILSKITLIFNMLAGRLELFPIFVLFSTHTWFKR